MEKQEILEMEIGTKEQTALEPARVKIVDVEVQEVGEKKNQKLVCIVKHPGKEEAISISSVKYEKAGKLQVTGLWLNVDEDKKIRKGSALAILLNYLLADNPKQLEGKEIDTALDEKGYLTFKVY